MQVNKVHHSPNFMALRLRPSSQGTLENSSIELIKKLNKIGSDLKDTKYYDLEIDGNLVPHITSSLGTQYRPPFSIIDLLDGYNGRYFQLEMVWDGSTEPYKSENRYSRLIKGNRCVKTLVLDDDLEAEAANAQFKSLLTDIEKGAFLVKLFDSVACKKYEKLGHVAAGSNELKEAVRKLFAKYGI